MNDPQRTQTQTQSRTATREAAEDRQARRRLLRSNVRNNVRKLREDRLLSKAELARRAGVSPLTIDRVESGKPCRMDTKRKIILALGMTIENKDEVFVPGQSGALEQGADEVADARGEPHGERELGQQRLGQEQDEPKGS